MVTGAAKRVARCFVERLLNEPSAKGLKITGHYFKSKKEIDELGALVTAKGHQFFGVSADLRDTAASKRWVGEAVKRLGPVDVLINSASDFFSTPALTCSEAEWDSLMGLNLRGQFFLAQACAQSMQGRQGVILNLIDVYAERASKNFVAYAATKGGLLNVTRNLAREWAPHIRVNGVSPGAVLFPETYTEAQKQKAIDRSLLKRAGSPEDIAEALLFLIQNDYITGQNLNVDGGRSIV